MKIQLLKICCNFTIINEPNLISKCLKFQLGKLLIDIKFTHYPIYQKKKKHKI